MSTKPGNYGGFHIINIDDTIEVRSDRLINSINSDDFYHVMKSDDDYGNIVNIYIVKGISLFNIHRRDSILFEVISNMPNGNIEKHYHIPPESLDMFEKLYSDLIKIFYKE